MVMRALKGRRLAILLAGVLALSGANADVLVRTQEEYRDAVNEAEPGTRIVLANGTWQDFEILLTGEGTEDAPITLTAETKGKVIPDRAVEPAYGRPASRRFGAGVQGTATRRPTP